MNRFEKKMRALLFLLLVLAACKSGGDTETSSTDTSTQTTTTTRDTAATPTTDSVSGSTDTASERDDRPVYSNQRFRNVRVQKLGGNRFLITGEGQIFEANFGWYVEDGHEELKSGNEMTDAGAPEWGTFSFTVRVKKKRPNSTLHIVLYESSAQDGSRQHELPVLLY